MSNKRAKSEALYAELVAEDYVLPAGKSLRGMFIDRATTEFGMTSKGAATYYVNAKKRHEGGVVPNYYKAKTPPAPPVGSSSIAIDSRWSVVKIEDGKVAACYSSPTEEKARKEFDALRPANKAVCMVVPGVMSVGEQVSHVSNEAISALLVSANPGDQEEEE